MLMSSMYDWHVHRLQFHYGLTSQGWAPIRGGVTSLSTRSYVDLSANGVLRVCLWAGPPPVILSFLLAVQDSNGPITVQGPFGLQDLCPTYADSFNITDFAYFSGACNTDNSFSNITFHTSAC